MTTTNATNFRKNAFEYLNQAVEYNDVISVTTKKGTAIIMSEEDYAGMMETFQLLSVPGMRERMAEAKATPIEECDDFEW